MQYTTHYNLNLPEGTDIVNPLIQDNPNYSAIDTALYDNKLRVIGNATHVKTGTNHAITRADSDIVAFKFVATGDYAIGDTFTVDGVPVTVRLANGKTPINNAFVINSVVECILDGTALSIINIQSTMDASDIDYSNVSSGLSATKVQGAIDEINGRVSDNIFDAYTDISGYTSIDNLFTAPSDGYAIIINSGSDGGVVRIYGAPGSGLRIGIGGFAGRYAVFIKKGMKMFVEGTNSGAEFIYF